ncbi:MAG: hypothetical protein ACP5JV_07280 [Thermus sp.]|uniref:hypothetical protein n=1 Tax=Thermus sp. TaxID=275 RepID=UPI003D14307C
MRPVDALARYLWEEEADVFTDPLEPPGHLVVRDGRHTRTLLPNEVAALAAALWGMGLMDRKGRRLLLKERELTPWG